MIELAEDNDDWSTWRDDHSEFYNQWLDPVRDLAWQLGYSVGVHGSMRRDMDLIAVPWIDDAASAETLAWAICRLIGGFEPYMVQRESCIKPHGRCAWAIHFYGGNVHNIHRYIDLSVMPRK